MSVRNCQPRRALALLAACSVMVSAVFLPAAAASADMIKVYMDHARILKLDRAVSKVIIGNSQVADVTVADAQTIVLTGKSYGTTNLVVLDTDGDPIVDETVLVSIDEANTVRIYRQIERTVLSCSPYCEEHAVKQQATP